MRFRLPIFLVSLGALLTSRASDAERKYEVEAAPEFLFERRPINTDCAGKIPPLHSHGEKTVLVAGNLPPYILTHSEQFELTRSEVPSLTITADPSNSIFILGNNETNWFIRFCSEGGGQTETEAREHLRKLSMTRIGATISVTSPPIREKGHQRGSLFVEAPSDAPIVALASYSAVQVRDVAGPLRVTATHARATILGTTGRVNAAASVLDFAGSRGIVNLSAETEINLKMTAPRFDGELVAWAQRTVRVLVPPGFSTPFKAWVNRPQDFVCRANFCPKVTREKKDGLYVFTYVGDGNTPPERFHLRSESSTIVVDTSGETRPTS